MLRALTALLIACAACGASAPAPTPAPAPPPAPAPYHCYTYTWPTGHGSSCFPAAGVCDGHAEEARADPVYTAVTGCAPAARAFCYDLRSPATRLCYATAEDCAAARVEEPGEASGCAEVTGTPPPPRTTPPS